MWRLIALLALTLVAWGTRDPAVSTTPAPTASQQASQAAATDGPFHLTFVLPRATWGSAEAIEGEARLALTQGNEVSIYGSGDGVLAFEFREVGGDRHMDPAWTADCARHSLAVGRPMVSAITKSGAWSDDQPDAQFYRDFFTGPEVRLPPGEWDITAVAMFVEGEGCAGTSHDLRATVRVHITD